MDIHQVMPSIVCLFINLFVFLLICLFLGSNVPLNVFEFTFSFGLTATALPFSWVVGASLYSKLLPMNIQGT